MTGYRAVWQYRVRPEHLAEFERAYGPDGDWAELFRRGDGYRGTELVRGAARGEYATIDRWVSVEAYASFLERWGDDYAALDQRFQLLTDVERLIVQGPLVE